MIERYVQCLLSPNVSKQLLMFSYLMTLNNIIVLTLRSSFRIPAKKISGQPSKVLLHNRMNMSCNDITQQRLNSLVFLSKYVMKKNRNTLYTFFVTDIVCMLYCSYCLHLFYSLLWVIALTIFTPTNHPSLHQTNLYKKVESFLTSSFVKTDQAY